MGQLEEKVKHIKGPVDKGRAEIYLSGDFVSVPALLALPVSIPDGQHLHEWLELAALKSGRPPSCCTSLFPRWLCVSCHVVHP